MAVLAGSTRPDDLTELVKQQAEQIRVLQSQVDGLMSHLDPWSGDLIDARCGYTRLNKNGIVIGEGSSVAVEEGLLRLSKGTSRAQIYSGAWRILSSW